ncbi:MAG: esterase/lipase family protein, partial [Steroidobacteraceae bacterium]
AWADPNEAGAYGCGRSSCPSTGLMQALVANGFKVFAIGFPHKNGDGYFWAEQIHDAISVVKQRTGAATVDVVSWSKSAFNARMYVSSVKQPWGTAYQADVRRLIMLGGPNNGIDLSFRHGWSFSLTVYPECGGVINGPTPHDMLVCFGLWRSGPQWTYSSSYFPGSAQMLKRWDSTYGLPAAEQDWYTTYYGGWGFYTHGNGITSYLGASLVNTVRSAGTDSGVKVHNLCGNQPDIALLHNEHTGPSDGVLFISSCNDATGITTHGGSAVVAVNHLELGWDTPAVNQIKSWLNAP